jgi:hypothetical protein
MYYLLTYIEKYSRTFSTTIQGRMKTFGYVALLEGRLRVEVVTRRLQESRDRLLLRRRHERLDERRVLLELVLNRHRNVQERLRRDLRAFVRPFHLAQTPPS